MQSIPTLSTQNLIRRLTTGLESASDKHIPSPIVSIIAEYAFNDYSAALGKLEVPGGDRYDRGKVLDNDHNKNLASAVKAALISDDCDPAIKSEIFINFCSGRHFDPVYVYFRGLLNEIVVGGGRLNLNNAKLDGLTLFDVNMTRMTAAGATFVGTHFAIVRMPGATLIDTDFSNAEICHSTDMSDAGLNGAKFYRTIFRNIKMSRADTTNAMFLKAFLYNVTVTVVRSDDPSFRQLITLSTIDSWWPFSRVAVKTSVIQAAVFTSGFGVDLDETINQKRLHCLR